jgi:hypothetical protein
MEIIVKLAGAILSMGIGVVLLAFGLILLFVVTDEIYKYFMKK